MVFNTGMGYTSFTISARGLLVAGYKTLIGTAHAPMAFGNISKGCTALLLDLPKTFFACALSRSQSPETSLSQSDGSGCHPLSFLQLFLLDIFVCVLWFVCY